MSRRETVVPNPARGRLGRETAFSLEPADDPVFDRRLSLPGQPKNRWIVLGYRMEAGARPLRPMVRLVRDGSVSQDFVLPGVALDTASWLGMLPADLSEIRLALPPGLMLERVALRSHASLLAQCLAERPLRLVPALYNALRRDERRFRDILRGACAVSPMVRYPAWRAARTRPDPSGAGRSGTAPSRCFAAHSHAEPASASSERALAIRLILPAGRADAADVARTIESLRAQAHRAWTLLVARTGGDQADLGVADARIAETAWDEAAPAAALLAGADALGILRPGDRLRPEALAILAKRLAAPDAPDLVYADEEVDGSGPMPRLKPDWSPDLALVTGYHGRPSLLARRLVERLDLPSVGPADGSSIDLAAITAAERVAHVPRILCRTSVIASAAKQSSPSRRAQRVPGLLRLRLAMTAGVSHDAASVQPMERRERCMADLIVRANALDRHLAATGSPARTETVGGVLDLRWPVPEPAPLVSIVIPSRERLDLIGRVTEGVLTRTDYPAIQLVIVDNGSTDPGVLRLYETLRIDPRVRLVAYPRPFNFSAMINAGARAADGRVLVLLNNDIDVLEPGWLRALTAQALRPEVGAVGAKLLYANGTLQHAGVVVGLGGRAGHILRRRPGDAPGHLGRMRVAHEVSAVTAACLAVAHEKFEAVGGLDEVAFAVDFNDVDFCLRLGARGWKSVWTPKAVLAHLESVSRGPPTGAARARFEREAETFAARWRDVIRHDPFYHPGLSLTTFGEDLE